MMTKKKSIRDQVKAPDISSTTSDNSHKFPFTPKKQKKNQSKKRFEFSPNSRNSKINFPMLKIPWVDCGDDDVLWRDNLNIRI